MITFNADKITLKIHFMVLTSDEQIFQCTKMPFFNNLHTFLVSCILVHFTGSNHLRRKNMEIMYHIHT